MKTKAAVFTDKGGLEVREYDLPSVAPLDMLEKVEIAGICGTDVHIYQSLLTEKHAEAKHSVFLGHEWVGRIVEMGAGFPRHDITGTPIGVGDRIAVYPATWACGKCYSCRILCQPNICVRPKYPRKLPQIGGAFSQYQYIPEGSVIYRISSEIPLETAVLVEPTAAALRALERAFMPGIPDRFQGMGPGKNVVILGTGTIGILLVALSRLCGSQKTIAIGAPSFRLELCKSLGADRVINIDEIPDAKEREEIVQEMTKGLGADVVIEAAGVPEALIQGIRLTRRGGTLVEFGHYTPRGSVSLDPFLLCYKDIHLFGSWGYGPSGFGSALRVLETYQNKTKFDRIVTHKFPLENIDEALHLAKSQECAKVVILPWT